MSTAQRNAISRHYSAKNAQSRLAIIKAANLTKEWDEYENSHSGKLNAKLANFCRKMKLN